MSTLTRAAFVETLRGSSIRVGDLNGVTANERAQLRRADVNGDGVIRGEAELNKMFQRMDSFDRNGVATSVDTSRAPMARMTEAIATAANKPRTALRGGAASTGTTTTTTPSGTSRRADAYVNGQRTSIETKSIGGGRVLRSDAADAFNRMREAARRDGVNLNVVSAFRTMESQRALYRAYQNGTGNLAARPGYSNHQGGTAVDIETNRSRSSAAYRWLSRNAADYGFRNTVASEPWHWSYRG